MKKLLLSNLLASITLASLLSVIALTVSGKEKEEHAHYEEAAIARLNLSDQQKQDIRQIRKETKQDLSLYRGEGKKLRENMRTLMQADVWDDAAVRAAIEEQMAAKLQSKLIKAKSKNKVFNQLSDEQQAQIISYRSNNKQRRGMQKIKRKGKNHEHKLQALSKALDLNKQQEAQLLLMMQSNKAQAEANKAQLQQLKAELSSIVQATTFDEDAWLALQTSNQAQLLELAVNKAKSRFDMFNVLNSEQREKFTKIMKKSKKEKMNRRRNGGHRRQDTES